LLCKTAAKDGNDKELKELLVAYEKEFNVPEKEIIMEMKVWMPIYMRSLFSRT
jgi:hypothetical protein